MKKLTILMIAIFFLILGSGSAFASQPGASISDSRAVWNKWFDENGNRLPEQALAMDSTTVAKQNFLTQGKNKNGMTGKIKKFDFVHETKVYDYAKDKRNST